MRIAIVNELWTAGATRCARDLQRGLQERHDVRYFPDNVSLTANEQFEQLEAHRPDVVHLHSYYGDLPYDFLARVASRFPTVVTPHDPRPIGDTHLKCWDCDAYRTCFRCPLVGAAKRYSLISHTYFWRRREKRRVHAHLPKHTAFVCVSEWMRQRMLQTELARFRIERIYNGVDLDRFRRDPDARKRLGLPPDAKVVCFMAHHAGWTSDERKGGHILAQALAEVVIPQTPDVIVLAVGGGMIPNLPNVRPIGFIKPEDVATYYSAADVFVAPSLADNLPYTVLEAMACEVPVIASRVGGIPEQVLDGRTGALVDPNDPKALGEALIGLLVAPGRMRELGVRARQRVAEDFDMHGFVAKYEALYQQLQTV
jgi:glycosyltransferase involved in cell wall biosynthesis